MNIPEFDFLEPCERLLKGGSLVDDKTWQPDGCMLHLYEER